VGSPDVGYRSVAACWNAEMKFLVAQKAESVFLGRVTSKALVFKTGRASWTDGVTAIR
jgi:hypothetical protein